MSRPVSQRLPLLAGGLAATLVLLCGLAGWLIVADPATKPSSEELCAGDRYSVTHVTGGFAPYIALTAGGLTGAFLFDYGTTSSTVSASHYPQTGSRSVAQPASSTITVSDFSLPSFKSATFQRTTYHVRDQPRGGQLGIVGTDFLSLLTADFTFTASGSSVILSNAPCSRKTLRHAALVPIDQTGFFTSNPARLPPHRPNVPILHVRLGPVTTWAQIDSGYDDRVAPPSIDINQALHDRLIAAGVQLERRTDISLATCAGQETRNVFRIAKALIEDGNGDPISQLANVTLVLKPKNRCGGIASFDRPAAQIGASILRRIGRVVFDPKHELVWLMKDKTLRPAPPQPPRRASQPSRNAPEIIPPVLRLRSFSCRER